MPDTFRALLLTETDGAPNISIETLGDDALPEGDVTVSVTYSTLNYKDGMVLKGLGRLVRSYPHVPGIDFAGTVETSADPRFAPGDPVILTGWRVGESHWGGFASRARVRGDWLVKLPNGLDLKRAMAIGTAGFTAALALTAVEEQNAPVAPDSPLLVTGAAGGVGSMAVALAAKAGHTVVASSGRPEASDYLKSLGAAEIIDRAALTDGKPRPLEGERWGAAIDSVGSNTLGRVLAQLRHSGVVAACGLAGGNDLPGTILPFLLRGVRLIGIDSVLCPTDRREAAWQRLARDLQPAMIDAMTTVAPLTDLPALADQILNGQVRGRVVIDVNA